MPTRMTIATVRFVPTVSVRAVLRQGWIAAADMVRARRTRALLVEMDDRMLADLGIGRGAAQAEAARAPWDLHERR